MANRAYLSVWCRDFGEEILPERLEQFLSTVPASATQSGFSDLVIRAVGPEEMPIVESEMRRVYPDAVAIAEVAREHLNSDSAYEVRAYLDLWVFNTTTSVWQFRPEPVEIRCYGEEYDGGVWKEYGHFHVDAGFEHLFTGHARLLGFGAASPGAVEHPDEARFVKMMASDANFRTYHDRTRENIRKLLDWMQRIERALPVDQARLWSEGEENFESRIEEILAMR
jgi:hypothetical protein